MPQLDVTVRSVPSVFTHTFLYRRPSSQYGHRPSVAWDLEKNKNVEYNTEDDEYDSDEEVGSFLLWRSREVLL